MQKALRGWRGAFYFFMHKISSVSIEKQFAQGYAEFTHYQGTAVIYYEKAN